MTYRTSLSMALLASLILLPWQTPLQAREAADLAIVGGRVHDGSAAPSAVGDVVVRDGRIIAVGPEAALRYTPARTLLAQGRVVAPGFIDPHTHPDTYIRAAEPDTRQALPWLHQGVTTIGIGVDGGGRPDVSAQRAWFTHNGVGVNLVPFVGLGPVRRQVLGDDARAPDTEEMKKMQALIAHAMCEGAFGLSTGLFYAPQSFTSTEEVIALAREAALRGGLYDTHQRDESSYGIGLLASTREALEIGRTAGLPVHLAHIKALGADVHGEAGALIELVESAREQGQHVTADQYPWLASGTSLSAAVLPRWAQDGGRSALLQRLSNPAIAERIAKEVAANIQRRGGGDALLLTAPQSPWRGRTIADLSNLWNVDVVEATLRIIRGDGMPQSRPAESVASFNMHPDDLRLLMRQPWVVTSSDGTDGHPRQYGSFPEKYARYVVEQAVLDLDTFIHRSTGLTASILGLSDRGVLRTGAAADIVVFDPNSYAPGATYLSPKVLARGVETLLVNGVLAIDGARATTALSGQMLTHRPPAETCRLDRH